MVFRGPSVYSALASDGPPCFRVRAASCGARRREIAIVLRFVKAGDILTNIEAQASRRRPLAAVRGPRARCRAFHPSRRPGGSSCHETHPRAQPPAWRTRRGVPRAAADAVLRDLVEADVAISGALACPRSHAFADRDGAKLAAGLRQSRRPATPPTGGEPRVVPVGRERERDEGGRCRRRGNPGAGGAQGDPVTIPSRPRRARVAAHPPRLRPAVAALASCGRRRPFARDLRRRGSLAPGARARSKVGSSYAWLVVPFVADAPGQAPIPSEWSTYFLYARTGTGPASHHATCSSGGACRIRRGVD